MDTVLRLIKKLIPKKLFASLQPTYHRMWAWGSAVWYGYPSRKIKVVAITGTKGKSSTTEIVNALLEAGGKKTAMAGTIRFKVGDKVWPNKYKMSVPGRGFIQKFLKQAVDAGCEYAVLEMTSEAAKQYRHKYINYDALIFLNISPEHIESHGGFENYLKAKLSIAHALEDSKKENKTIIANADDKESEKFLNIDVSNKLKFWLKNAEPYTLDHFGSTFTYKNKIFRTHLQGTFNISNILAAITYVQTQGVTLEQIQIGLDKLKEIAGRVQKVTLPAENPLSKKQNFEVVVDYAHTADSLQKLYSVFKDSRKIGVLGNTGGGRDTWKRPEMAKVANAECSHIILTNEDPYDEDPMKIINDMVPSITTTPYEIIMDRRAAINKAISLAKPGDTVLISGKGTDPYIMEANGKKTPWSDYKVAQEELEKVLAQK
jgi:UDP-N-acetylmuramoyl-L-alanyl-D-glutamate--2,6-diaminopimelate ligase